MSSFIVDRVSEDSFYENLLLGITKILDKCQFVTRINLKRFPGVKQIDIRAWEHNNGVILPEDLRAFYSSTNGFYFSYEFSYDYHSDDVIKDYRLGLIQINSLNELTRIFNYETKNTAKIDIVDSKRVLSLSKDSKVFKLHDIDDNAKIVLVYPTIYSIPTIWFYDNQRMAFAYLADDMMIYFRMCIAHLGVPCWQYMYSKDGLPEWATEMFNIMAPAILSENQHGDSKHQKFNVSTIDSSIFSAQSSSSAAAAAASNSETKKSAGARAVKEKSKGKSSMKKGNK